MSKDENCLDLSCNVIKKSEMVFIKTGSALSVLDWFAYSNDMLLYNDHQLPIIFLKFKEGNFSHLFLLTSKTYDSKRSKLTYFGSLLK